MQKGQTFSIEVHKTRQRTGPGFSGKTATPVHLTVLEANERTAVLDWFAGDTQFSDPAHAAHPVVKAVESAARGLHLRFEVNARDYTWLRIVNQAEVRAAVTRLIDTVLKQLSSQMPDEARRRQVLATVRRMMDPETLAQSVGNEARLLFSIPRGEWKAGTSTSYQGTVPSPIGGGELKAEVRTHVLWIDEASHEAEVELTRIFDPGSLAAMMKQLAAAAGAPAAQATPSMSVSDSAEYTFDLRHAVPMRVVHTRRIVAGATAARTDTTEIIRR